MLSSTALLLLAALMTYNGQALPTPVDGSLSQRQESMEGVCDAPTLRMIIIDGGEVQFLPVNLPWGTTPTADRASLQSNIVNRFIMDCGLTADAWTANFWHMYGIQDMLEGRTGPAWAIDTWNAYASDFTTYVADGPEQVNADLTPAPYTGIDFGSCQSPAIRQRSLAGASASYIPYHSCFNWGDVGDLMVMVDLIAGALSSHCGAPQATIDLATQAKAAAASTLNNPVDGLLTAGSAVDAYNNVFGVLTAFGKFGAEPFEQDGTPGWYDQ